MTSSNLSFETYVIPRIMVVLHAVGVIGILAGYGKYFLDFTAVNLLINGGLAIWRDWEDRHWVWLVAIGGGLAVEIFGVQTGWLFGSYSYGEVLGPKIAGVPFILGMLWWISLMGLGHWSDRIMTRWMGALPFYRVKRAAVAATLMTALDGLIEPVAIQAGWWSWEGGEVPWTNYVSWWVLSFLFHLIPQRTNQNIGAGLLVVIFVLFFLFLNWFPWTR